jgi:antitoxin YefM
LVFHLPISNFQNEEGEMMRVSLKQTKRDFEKLVEEIRHSKDRLLIEKDGLPIAVLLNMDDFEDLMETVGELAAPKYLTSIREARAEYKPGEVDTLEDLYTKVSTGGDEMSEVIMAIYEKGMLRPLEELPLEERQRVTLKIITKRSIVQETKAMFKAPPQILKEIAESEELLEWGG